MSQRIGIMRRARLWQMHHVQSSLWSKRLETKGLALRTEDRLFRYVLWKDDTNVQLCSFWGL